MFYKMIERKCREWFQSEECTVRDLIDYIEKTGQMRDAQIGAIKIYLFLKIACECRPLAELFQAGTFNAENLDEIELSKGTRQYLAAKPAARALFEYSRLKNDKGEQVSTTLEKKIKQAPESLDYENFFQSAFYNISYTDYLFSLPMGAGKTYLMAAFIYLDLYFAQNEPSNPAFAHNFIILVPSGLKSSVIPSLKTIQRFNPAWVIPEPAASELKRRLSFEVLDQTKTASRSNRTKNPNVQKIANHQPFKSLFGLVAITNAEKVILDRVKEKDGQVDLFEASDDDKDRQANELRHLIGQLPALSIFIDEVHHAVSDEIKLRTVVTQWAKQKTVNAVVGFSGTPYLPKAEKIKADAELSVATAEITNIVYFYPLLKGIGNFLKKPKVRIADIPDSSRIIDKGVREFLDAYKDTAYADGLTAKLGIYCGTIEKLEETVYPLVLGIAAEYGLGAETILKFHKGNKHYKLPTDSQMQFDMLDKSISRIRIILLVQIGKEGWDCRSLTGIILSQERDCPTNMVLQTSCRCLRQVTRQVTKDDAQETALIYLNESNAKKLEAQLEQQHHISLKEFTSANHQKTILRRYDRTEYLHLPKVKFCQLKIRYDTQIVEQANPARDIATAADTAREAGNLIITTELGRLREAVARELDDTEYGTAPATFSAWLYGIMKGGFGTPTLAELKKYEDELQKVYQKITYKKDGRCYYSSRYRRKEVEANIRKAFHAKRDFRTKEELVPEAASLLNIKNFTTEVSAEHPQDYYPNQRTVEKIVKDDAGELVIDDKTAALIKLLEEMGRDKDAAEERRKVASHSQKDRSFHYLPYHTDSSYEQAFLQESLSLDIMEELGLEIYYNGDGSLTEFRIKCYATTGSQRRYLGMYTPDFLIIQRKDGEIYKALIVETKGELYAHDPIFRQKKDFMQGTFLEMDLQSKCNSS